MAQHFVPGLRVIMADGSAALLIPGADRDSVLAPLPPCLATRTAHHRHRVSTPALTAPGQGSYA